MAAGLEVTVCDLQFQLDPLCCFDSVMRKGLAKRPVNQARLAPHVNRRREVRHGEPLRHSLWPSFRWHPADEGGLSSVCERQLSTAISPSARAPIRELPAILSGVEIAFVAGPLPYCP